MGRRQNWTLSAASLDALLSALSSDREIAAERYETIRAGLVQFFGRHVECSAESLADQTIDRVCHRVEQGETFERVGPFFYGVARNVLREHLKATRRHEHLQREAMRQRSEDLITESEIDDDTSERLDAMRRCLDRLDPHEVRLMREYYGMSERGDLTLGERRAALAQDLGISQGNLRLRAFRVRQRIERCCQEELESQQARSAAAEESPK